MNPKLVQFKTGEGGGAHIQKQNIFFNNLSHKNQQNEQKQSCEMGVSVCVLKEITEE